MAARSASDTCCMLIVSVTLPSIRREVARPLHQLNRPGFVEAPLLEKKEPCGPQSLRSRPRSRRPCCRYSSCRRFTCSCAGPLWPVRKERTHSLCARRRVMKSPNWFYNHYRRKTPGNRLQPLPVYCSLSAPQSSHRPIACRCQACSKQWS
jgi:hypothetical protein